jgi:hypothetical protein
VASDFGAGAATETKRHVVKKAASAYPEAWNAPRFLSGLFQKV